MSIKRLFPKMLLLFLFSAIFSQEMELTSDFLTTSPWGPNDFRFGYWITFNKDGTFQYEYAGEGSIKIKGKYSISGITIKCIADPFKDEIYNPTELKQKIIIWQLQEDNESIFSNRKIVSNTGYTFWRAKSRPKSGTLLKINDVNIIILDMQSAIINIAAKVRSGPGTQYSEKIYSLDVYNGKPRNYIPEETSLDILGRSEEKSVINGIEQYWYYCHIGLGWYESSSGNDFGWIFGGLIKF